MGRYQTKTTPATQPSVQQEGSPFMNQQQPQYSPEDWPTTFTKSVIGIDRDGVINEWKNVIKRREDVQFIAGSLEAIRKLRLIGHKVVLFADQPNIQRGLLKGQDVDNIFQYMMQQFGQAGIFSIDGFYYNVSDMPQDHYAKPNIGMLNRAKNELGVDFTKGYYVGDTIEDIKMAIKAKATPVLVRTGKGADTERKYLKSFDTKYKDVQVFDSLLDFANSL
jgi:D-glycero-D-manno-heptose 1,7-bisphosphate phosphatase